MKRSAQALGVLFVVVALGLVGAAPAQALTKAQTQLVPVGGPADFDLDDPMFIPLKLGLDYAFTNTTHSVLNWPASGIPSDADPGVFNTATELDWFGTAGGINVPLDNYYYDEHEQQHRVDYCLVLLFARIGQSPVRDRKTTPLFSPGEAGFVLNSYTSTDANFLGIHGGAGDPSIFFDGPGTNLFTSRMGNNTFGAAFRGVTNHAIPFSYNWAIFENQVTPGTNVWHFAQVVLQVKVPEPNSALLSGMSLLGLLAVGRRVRRARS